MKTLVSNNAGFGDVLWTEPIAQALLDMGHQVNLFVAHPSAFDNHPSPHLVLNDYGSLFSSGEDSIKLGYRDNPKKHLLETYREQAGLPGMELRYPRLYLSDSEKRRKRHGDYALLHLDLYRAQHNHPRNVYGVDWEKVMSFLRASGLTPLQITGKENGMFLPVAPVAPTKDFRDVMSWMLHAKLFIGLDSGPSHIAALMRIPSVIFFGYVNPVYRHLDFERKVFLQNSCPFAHCSHESREIPICRRTRGDQGAAPPCCVHNEEKVISAIESVLRTIS